MSEKTIQLYQPTSQLMNSTNQSAISELANRLMKFPPSNKALNQREAAQLAVFSIMIDANPYAGEVYPTEVGPVIGIPLYRRKAKEWNRAMAPSGEEWDYKVNFRPAEDHEADFDPTKGDVAWICELTDTKAEKEWQAAYAKFFNLLREGDDPAPWQFADERALMMAGPRPVWSGTGVVGGNERFSKGEVERWEKKNGKNIPVLKKDEQGKPIYKQEMYDRNERAQKRAEKVALKKRYPDLIIPEFGEVQDSNMTVLIENAEGEMVKAEEYRAEKMKNFDEKQALRDLGFEVEDDQIEEGEFVDADGSESDSQVEDAGQPAPQSDGGPLWNPNKHKEDAGIYWDARDSNKKPYRDKDVAAISRSFTALDNKTKKFREPQNEAELKKQEDTLFKRDACQYWIKKKTEEQENG